MQGLGCSEAPDDGQMKSGRGQSRHAEKQRHAQAVKPHACAVLVSVMTSCVRFRDGGSASL